jgi:hypothetical protein
MVDNLLGWCDLIENVDSTKSFCGEVDVFLNQFATVDVYISFPLFKL